tara:strand:- start:101 stop:1522 length:1422 start_codon:yes stop_codon:yes gene_type:complete
VRTPFQLLLLIALLLVALPNSQAGAALGRHVEFPRLGLEVEPPATWQRIPIPPREDHVQLLWGIPVTSGRSPSVGIAVLHADDAEGIVDTATYLQKRAFALTSELLHPGARRFGHTPVRYTYTQADEDGQPLKGFLHGWEADGRTIIVQGLAPAASFDAHFKTWQRFAESIVIETPRERVREHYEWTRYYGQRRFPDRERRVAARLSSVEGWDARDSEHYLVLSHAGSPELTKRFLDRLEALHRRLATDLDGIAGSAKTGVVRICKDRDEYLLYGGDRRAWGYFSPSEGELVLHLVTSEEATLRTLQHEAFHQFVFHATGGVSPHSWFDEGLAEHYGTATVEDGRVTGFAAPEDMLRPVKALVDAERTVPVADLLAMDQKAYYADPHRCYPQGWALVRWLEMEARGRKAQLLSTYFDELTQAWAEALESLAGETNPERWSAARAATRQVALERALRGQDLAALERDWLKAMQR